MNMNTHGIPKRTSQRILTKPLQAILAALIVSYQMLSAATLSVTNSADSGAGTFRAAVAGAGNNDTITFDLSAPAKITLTSGQLIISKSLTILGPGPAALAFDGNGTSTVMGI